jgi:hypothetical protein
MDHNHRRNQCQNRKDRIAFLHKNTPTSAYQATCHTGIDALSVPYPSNYNNGSRALSTQKLGSFWAQENRGFRQAKAPVANQAEATTT